MYVDETWFSWLKFVPFAYHPPERLVRWDAGSDAFRLRRASRQTDAGWPGDIKAPNQLASWANTFTVLWYPVVWARPLSIRPSSTIPGRVVSWDLNSWFWQCSKWKCRGSSWNVFSWMSRAASGEQWWMVSVSTAWLTHSHVVPCRWANFHKRTSAGWCRIQSSSFSVSVTAHIRVPTGWVGQDADLERFTAGMTDSPSLLRPQWVWGAVRPLTLGCMGLLGRLGSSLAADDADGVSVHKCKLHVLTSAFSV